jgi:2-polyprenyl-3-methyl-5-hydroxy-6-metoxy-1,4-benzoquinol methylase
MTVGTPLRRTYDNPFEPDSVYGHALQLLLEHQTQTPAGAIHLDIGCGYGRIAEHISAELGVSYVGVDMDAAGLCSLAGRGFETHNIVLDGENDTLRDLRSIVGGRPVASVSLIDTLEHLPDGDRTLRALAKFAAERSALVVVSVPNFAHADIAMKLLLGRLDVTDVGLLDHTHTRVFTAASFDATLAAAGLRKLAEKNTRVRHSDQHFPVDQPFLAEGTAIGALLRTLRDSADPDHAEVMQLVRLCVPGPSSMTPPWMIAYRPEVRPFLSVITRTQGRRLHALRETLLALYGQTDRDIEIIVVGHKLSPDGVKAVERVIEDQPKEMRTRTRFLRADSGGRARPLNVGFTAATGRYIAILDDDDIPFAHWVETFRHLHERTPGRILRANGVRQTVRNITIENHSALRAENAPTCVYPSRFDLFEHLRGNHTPPVTVAFPRGVFHDLDVRFDEALSTTEDWDYIMRVAQFADVSSSAAVTSVYRWWDTDESSRSVHDQDEWDRNYSIILHKMDAAPLLLPSGSAGRLRYLLDVHDSATLDPKELAMLRTQAAELETVRGELATQAAELETVRGELATQAAELETVRGELVAELERANAWAAELETVRGQLAHLRSAIDRSFVLRLARAIPRPIRTIARGTATALRRIGRRLRKNRE